MLLPQPGNVGVVGCISSTKGTVHFGAGLGVVCWCVGVYESLPRFLVSACLRCALDGIPICPCHLVSLAVLAHCLSVLDVGPPIRSEMAC
jgi:hypothetical protein